MEICGNTEGSMDIFKRQKKTIFYCSTDWNDCTKWHRQSTERYPNAFMIIARFSDKYKKERKISSKAKKIIY